VDTQPFRLLFLSQRNSARSMMAEAIANSIGHGQLQAYSAGVRPASSIDPIAIELHAERYRRRRGAAFLARPSDHGALALRGPRTVR
jgi:hypothetical protein